MNLRLSAGAGGCGWSGCDRRDKVVEAERVAKANLIRRQEETAATRSLINMGRLMEDNPLLLHLKQLEADRRHDSSTATRPG